MARIKPLQFALLVCTLLVRQSGGTLLPRLSHLPASVEKAEQLFQDAFKVYDLESPDVHPWHIRASYESFSEQGNLKVTGVFEELWVSRKRYRRSYMTPSFTQTDYATEQGILRDGDQRWSGQAEVQVRRSLVNPLPFRQELANAIPVLDDKEFGSLKLRCVSLTHPARSGSSAPPQVSSVYCFEMDKPTLRFESSYDEIYQTTFADPIVFQGRLIAQAIQVDLRGKPFLKIHLEKIEPLTSGNDADFTPPASAKRPIDRKIRVSTGIMAANLINRIAPVYPDEDKLNRIEGTVVFAATIDTDGHIAQLQTVSSPNSSLAAAAADAVHRWIYKPYLLNGEVVAVDTQINVQFKLHP